MEGSTYTIDLLEKYRTSVISGFHKSGICPFTGALAWKHGSWQSGRNYKLVIMWIQVWASTVQYGFKTDRTCWACSAGLVYQYEVIELKKANLFGEPRVLDLSGQEKKNEKALHGTNQYCEKPRVREQMWKRCEQVEVHKPEGRGFCIL